MPPRNENERYFSPHHHKHSTRHLGRVASMDTYHEREPNVTDPVTSELSRLDEHITNGSSKAPAIAAAQFLDIYYPKQIARDRERYPSGTRPIDTIAQLNAYAHVFSRLFENVLTDRLRDDLLNKMWSAIEYEALMRKTPERTLEAIHDTYINMMRGIRKEVESLHTLRAKGIIARSSTPDEDLNGYDIVATIGKREFYIDIKGNEGFDKLIESGHAKPLDGVAGVAFKRSSDRRKQIIVVDAVERGYDGQANHRFAFSNPNSFLQAAILGMHASAQGQVERA